MSATARPPVPQRSRRAAAGARTRRGKDRRRAILDAAREVFSTKGYEQTSMAEIAARVGVVEGAIYKHFGSKRELMFEATGDFYAPLIAAAKQHLAGVSGTRNRLRFVIWGQLQAFAHYPGLCRLIIQEIRPHEDYHGSVVHGLNREMTSMVLTILEQAQAAGELRPGVRPSVVRDLIFGGIEHTMSKVLAGRGTIDTQAEAEALTDLVMQGVQAPHEAAVSAGSEIAQLRAQVDRLEALVDRLTRERTRPRK